MDSALKQRLIGAGVLVLLAVIFLPMLVTGPAPDGTKDMQGVPANVPPVPDAQVDSRDMDFATTDPVSVAGPQVAQPTTYTVDFGKYATAGDARTVVDALNGAGLAATTKAVMVEGRTLHQILIGPFASASQAESARQAALKLSAIDGSRVIAQSGNAPAAMPAATAATPSTRPAATPPSAASSAPVASKPAAAADPVDTADDSAISTAPEPAKPQPAADTSRYTVELGSSPYPARSEALHKRAAAAGINTVLVKAKNDKGQPIVIVRTAPLSKNQAESVKAEVALKLQRTSQVKKL